jgi:diguanylate cyclase (GGDEF)-like protein
LLRETVNLLKIDLRVEDIIARYQNSTLVILIPDLPQKDAESYADELLEKIESIAAGDENLEIQFSTGVVEYKKSDLSREDLLAHAIHALNGKAKETE